MAILALSGLYANHLERLATYGNKGISGGDGSGLLVTNADTYFPKTNLSVGFLHQPFKFGTSGTDRSVTIDLNIVQNGGFESGADATSPPAGWVYGNGTSFQIETAQNNDTGGAASGRLTTTNHSGYQLCSVRSGERMTLSWAIRGDSVAQAQFFVKNLHTGKYLNLSTGAWQTSATADTQTAATWKTGSRTFTVENYATTRRDICSLQLACQQSGTGNTYYDSIYLWPEVDFAAVFGHNIETGITAEWRRDTAGFAGAGTLEVQPTVLQPSFYSSLGTSRSDRYWRFILGGTLGMYEVPWFGKLVLGQKYSFSTQANYGDERELDDSGQVRGTGGRAFVTMDYGRRIWSPEWRLLSDADYATFSEIINRGRTGAYPTVLVPYDSDPGYCLYGRWEKPNFKFKTVTTTIRDVGGMTFVEDPYPTWVSA